ncbi:MAG: M4 family metallopeptidase [Anaerolineae bacterium]|nr:M4 family metallopeptidase [Anaerolineae bacterium]NUQ06659.1 M4 family metallopeptidase [Anaerolineae bacterium]
MPIYPILPPFMLRHIVRAGDAEERRRAQYTLARDRVIRSARMELMANIQDVVVMTPPPPKGRRGRGLRRTIYIFKPHSRRKLPGQRVRTEGRPPLGDPAVDEAYDGLGIAYRFLREVFGRHSVDDHDLPLAATVHYSSKYSNAFWNGEQMVFGDGDLKLFSRFTGSLEIIGHELTHGIMQYTAQMNYTLQAGAVHESICDVMGILLKQWSLGQTVEASDWLIGAGLLMPGINGAALRSMKAPGTAYDDPLLGADPQPGHMDDFRRMQHDNGGVHINSGIPNRAFYLTAAALGGNAWERAGKVWYNTLCDKRLRPHYGFKRFARLTLRSAAELFGEQSIEASAVREAWAQVGISSLEGG